MHHTTIVIQLSSMCSAHSAGEPGSIPTKPRHCQVNLLVVSNSWEPKPSDHSCQDKAPSSPALTNCPHASQPIKAFVHGNNLYEVAFCRVKP